jgi:hypothetical protein
MIGRFGSTSTSTSTSISASISGITITIHEISSFLLNYSYYYHHVTHSVNHVVVHVVIYAVLCGSNVDLDLFVEYCVDTVVFHPVVVDLEVAVLNAVVVDWLVLLCVFAIVLLEVLVTRLVDQVVVVDLEVDTA